MTVLRGQNKMRRIFEVKAHIVFSGYAKAPLILED